MENKEEYLLPNGLRVTYYPEPHIYMVGDRELPSITTLIRDFYGDAYASVSPILLKKSAEYGTAVHEELQSLIEMRKIDPSIPLCPLYPETRNYFQFVESIYKIEPLDTEKVVVLYGPDGEPAAAGRFDLLCKVNGDLTLADFKTTSAVHRQLVTAQLNLYLKASVQSGYIPEGEDVKLGVIHLNGETGRFVPIIKLGDDFYLKFII